MAVKKKSTEKAKVLKLTGDLTILRGEEILTQLRDTLGKSRNVCISLQDVSAIDLPFLQLLCSAHRTAAKEKIKIVLKHADPDMFRNVVRQAGFKRRSGCAYSPDTRCLCNDGEE